MIVVAVVVEKLIILKNVVVRDTDMHKKSLIFFW